MKATLEIPGKWSVQFESCSEIEESVETETLLCHFIPEGGIRTVPQMQVLGECPRQGSFRLYSRNIDAQSLKNLVEWKKRVGDRKASEKIGYKHDAKLKIEVDPPSKLELFWSLSGAWISGLSWTHSSATQKPMLCAEISYDLMDFAIKQKVELSKFQAKKLPVSAMLSTGTTKYGSQNFSHLIIKPHYLVSEPTVSSEIYGFKANNKGVPILTDGNNAQLHSLSRQNMNSLMGGQTGISSVFPERIAFFSISFRVFPESPSNFGSQDLRECSLAWRTLSSVLMNFAPDQESGSNFDHNEHLNSSNQLNIPKALLKNKSNLQLEDLSVKCDKLISRPDENHIRPILVGIALSEATTHAAKGEKDFDFLGYLKSVTIAESFDEQNGPDPSSLTIQLGLYANKALLNPQLNEVILRQMQMYYMNAPTF